ncbi:hypothetical protein D3C81_2092840 [compost metagenome]
MAGEMTASAAKTPPVSRMVEPITGPRVAPSELKAWEKVSRKWAVRGSPRDAERGLAATCNRVTPLAMTNRDRSTRA